MRRLARLLSIVLAAFLTLGTHSYAVTIADLMDTLKAQDWDRAASEAATLDRTDGHGDIFAAYVAATRHAAQGRCAEAVFLGDLVIGSAPYFVPAYDLTYQCYLALGQPEAAIARLDSLLAVLPGGPQRDLVAQIKQNIQAADRPAINFFGEAAPSSNANRATAAKSVNGLTIVEEARATPGLLLRGGMSITQKLLRSDRYFLSGTIRLETKYSTASQLFEPKITLETPLTMALSDKVTATATPYAAFGFAGTDHATSQFGAQGVIAITLSPTQQLAFTGALYHTSHHLFPALDGWTLRGKAALNTLLGTNTLVSVSGQLEANLTHVPANRVIEAQASLRLDHAFEAGLMIGIEGVLGQRFHNRPAPFTLGANQTDIFMLARIEASHRNITFLDVMPTLYYQYGRSWSDSVFHTYESHDVGIALRKKL